MANLLYIKASPRDQHSYSLTAADTFIDEYKKANPDHDIKTVNLFKKNLPPFDGNTLQAKYNILHGKEHSPEDKKAWSTVEQIIDEFKSADKYILATPMWNFSIPYRLKQYLDIIVQPTYTFNFDPQLGYTGLVTGKPLLTICARGGEYSDEQSKQLDMQTGYINLIFKFIGFTDIRSIIIEPTLAAGPDAAKKALKNANEQAASLAHSF